MNIYDRKPVSSVLLSERLTAEIRNVQCDVKKLEKSVTTEIQHLKDVIQKQNKNALNYENLRNAIGNSKSAVITFTKPGENFKSTLPALFVKNNTYSGEKLKSCCSFTKNKSYTISATNMRAFGLNSANKKVKIENKGCKVRRTNSDCRRTTFDYVKSENAEIARTSMMAYRLENVFISEVQKISCVLEKLRNEVDTCFNKKKITEHYMGNKYRNAQVREDFPCALDEQIREQRLAEQAAALYHQMITEQEEQDAQVAKQLADKIEREELAKKRALEEEDEEIAKQILEREHLKQLDKQQRLLAQQSLQTQPASTSQRQQQQHIEQHSPLTQSPRKPEHHDSPRKGEHHDISRRHEYHESPKRQGYLMPLPAQSPSRIQQPVAHTSSTTAHYRSSSDDLLDPFQQCSIADALELGLPVDEVDEKRMQEERDAELARKLQEQESCSAEELQLNRDRMLAIEAQDKELAKLLQERERAKVRRAKERAKQKALAKKQQELNPDQILPDDSYSNPIDLLQHAECSHSSNSVPNAHTQSYRIPPQDCHAHDDDVNYSLPVDMLPAKAAYDHNLKQNYSQKNYDSRLNGYNHKSEIRAMNGGYLPGGSSQSYVGTSGLTQENIIPAVRPTQLDLKSPITKSMKPRPDPDSIEVCDPLQPDNNYPLHNIAMAIDPTYTRRTLSSHTPSSQDTSTISTSTTSSTTSPAISLPPPDLSEDEMSPVPPYMPIQGQRRTASLEKKKKRAKDGCKQQ